MAEVVLLRHGESIWNRENRFTGWTDVELSDGGVSEGHDAGRSLRESGRVFDVVFTSVLTRAIQTAWIVLEELHAAWIPVYKHWRLNERHYGALQGLNKAETAAVHGEEQVHRWRRGFADRPPALAPDDERCPGHDPRYRDVPREQLPLTESLRDTLARVLPYWHEQIVPHVSRGERVLIVAHGNSLRALVMHFEQLSPEAITEVNIPTGAPIVYQLDRQLVRGQRLLPAATSTTIERPRTT